jgi:hypothetical protein
VGDYELLEEIARGAMGVVYRARQVSLDRVVALKMILAGQLASPADVARFHTEAEAAANLDHPNILPIYEVGEHEGQHYFSMKLIEGSSLAQRALEFVRDPQASARLLATTARAIHAAHQRGILHRDLKPANILLDAAGVPHVSDFGLAKKVEGDSGLTQSGAIVGTPGYMAPEQARAKKGLTTAADTYSLGAILYELLTGQPPFRAETPLDTVLQVIEKEPQRPRAVNPSVNPDLETICLKCLEKDPARRYGSALALAEDLERWQRGEPIAARPSTRRERVLKWVKRNPVLAGFWATAALLLLTLSVGGPLVAINQDTLRQEAEDNARDARKKKQIADQARKEVEETLAESLLRPLGHSRSPVNSIELDALWDLARSPSDSDRVRVLFIEKALARPETAEQLKQRSELAVHAAVGLDPQRRQRVLELLLPLLRDKGQDWRKRETCVALGIALDETEKEFALEAAKTTLEAMAKDIEPHRQVSRTRVFQAVADKLHPDQAAIILKTLVQILPREVLEHEPKLFADCYRALASKLPPEQLQKAMVTGVQAILHQMIKSRGEASGPTSYFYSLSLGVVLDDLISEETARGLSKDFLQRIDEPADRNNLYWLCEVLASKVIRKLDPEQAREVSAAAVKSILKKIDARDSSYKVRYLALSLSWFPEKLQPDQKTEALQIILRQMKKTPDAERLEDLAYALSAVARQLGPDQSRAANTEAAQIILEHMDNPSKAGDLDLRFALALAWLPETLERDQSARLTKMILKRMDEASGAGQLWHLGEALRQVARKLGPDSARTASTEAAEKILNKMKTAKTSELEPLARALREVAGGLDSKRAKAATQSILGKLSETTDVYALSSLAYTLGAVVPKVGPDEVRQESNSVVKTILKLMKTTHAAHGESLAYGLQAVAGELDAELIAEATWILLQLRPKSPEFDPRGNQVTRSVEHAYDALTSKLDPEQAAALTRRILQEIPKNKQTYDLAAVRLVATKIGLDQARKARDCILEWMEKTSDESRFLGLVDYLQALPGTIEPHQLSKAGHLILRQMQRSSTLHLPVLTRGLRELPGKAEPDQAALAAKIILERMDRKGVVGKGSEFDLNLKAVAELGPDHAAAAIEVILPLIPKPTELEKLNLFDRLLEEVTAKLGPDLGPTHLIVQSFGAQGLALCGAPLSALAQRLAALGVMKLDAFTQGPSRAGRIAPSLVERLLEAPYGDHRRSLAIALGPVTEGLSKDKGAPVAQVILEELARTAGEPGARIIEHGREQVIDGPKRDRLTGAFRAVAGKLDKQELVDLLKQPLCVGPARDIVLQRLGQLTRQRFNTLWEFVAWARQHEPNLDLASPPKRLGR